MTTSTKPTGAYLTGSVEINDSVRALLFGKLVELAKPIVQHYCSDLYHDAQWIEREITKNESVTFLFGCDAWGTAIGFEEHLVKLQRKNVWRVELQFVQEQHTTEERGSWYCHVEQIAEGTR